jgi:hypothetical protein
MKQLLVAIFALCICACENGSEPISIEKRIEQACSALKTNASNLDVSASVSSNSDRFSSVDGMRDGR